MCKTSERRRIVFYMVIAGWAKLQKPKIKSINKKIYFNNKDFRSVNDIKYELTKENYIDLSIQITIRDIQKLLEEIKKKLSKEIEQKTSKEIANYELFNKSYLLEKEIIFNEIDDCINDLNDDFCEENETSWLYNFTKIDKIRRINNIQDEKTKEDEKKQIAENIIIDIKKDIEMLSRDKNTDSQKAIRAIIGELKQAGIIRFLQKGKAPEYVWHFKLKIWDTKEINLQYYQEHLDDWNTNEVEKLKPSPEQKSAKMFGFEEAPYITNFYGRSDEFKKVTSQTYQRKVVIIWGFAGIGKTWFAEKISREVANKFNCVLWTRINYPIQVEKFLEEKILLNILPRQGIFESDYTSFVIKLLNKQKVLIIIDGLDELKESDDNIYKQYLTLLERIQQSNHESCVIVTSQEKPQTTVEFYNYQLVGLDSGAIASLLRDKGINYSDSTIKEFESRYGGNPQLIKMYGEIIKNSSSGSVENFLKETTYKPTKFRESLSLSFENFSEIKKAICYWLAIEGDKISFDNLKKRVYKSILNSRSTFINEIEYLEATSIICSQQNDYFVAPTVRRYIVDYLVEKVEQELNLLHSNSLKELLSIDKTKISFLINYRLLAEKYGDKGLKKSQERRILKPLVEFCDRDRLNLIRDELKKLNLAQEKIGYLADNLSLLNQEDIQSKESNNLDLLEHIMNGKLKFEDIWQNYSNKLNKDFFRKMLRDEQRYFALKNPEVKFSYVENLKRFCDLLTDKLEQFEEDNKKYQIEIAIKGYKIIDDFLKDKSMIESLSKDFSNYEKDVCLKLGTLYERRIREHKQKNQKIADEYFERSRKL